MKKLVSLMLITMLFTFALAQEGWMGHGVNITLENGTIKATSTRNGLNTLISPLFPINTTLKYSFSIRSEGTNGVLAEIAYFDENRTFMFAKNVTVIGKGSFGWKNVEIAAPSVEGATFSSLVVVINGTGTVYIDNFTVSEAKPIEKQKIESTTPTKTEESKKTEASTASQGDKDETTTNENSQKLSIDDDDIKIEVFLNKTYHPGDTIRADFYITNKKGTINEIDIRLDVYYLGIRVFSYEHPSWREYREGKTVHIFQKSKLPVITPPGKYTLKFYITPAGRETKELEGEITIKPNLEWILVVVLSTFSLIGIVLLIRRYWRLLVKTYREFSIGQRFVFFAVVGLIIAAIILALGAENYANDVAIVVYYLLLVGVLNEWIEYLEPKWDRESIRGVVSIYLLALLMYLSKDTFTVYPAIAILALGTIVGLLRLKSKNGKTSSGAKATASKGKVGIEEIEIVGKTEDGFIIYEIKGKSKKEKRE